ncbi:hypothetical protein ZIOFF_008126 [Zingiber officinale]|uniref:BAAT/Acyl-CoA thioester hydrolase C-terminal domain-containing protein n=1 Tax=Zingiber officinale TaxID=94328 RepID=A0A8J5IF02_ZINOF|nr:hypothetical protein ZIOFF_008126 [Zingiber officinale]
MSDGGTMKTGTRMALLVRYDDGFRESEGVFRYGNYRREAEDIRSVILYFLEQNYEISAIIGHSKGGNAVLLYASVYHDVHIVINISGRFALERGIEGRLGKDFMQRIEKDGFIDVKDKTGNFEYRVTEDSLKDRLETDMCIACHSIDKKCRVLLVHGSKDQIVPAEDAMQFAKLIPNHKLHIMEGANHCYTAHLEELASVVLNFMKSSQVFKGMKRRGSTVMRTRGQGQPRKQSTVSMGPESTDQETEYTGNPNEVDSGSSDRNAPTSTREHELQTSQAPAAFLLATFSPSHRRSSSLSSHNCLPSSTRDQHNVAVLVPDADRNLEVGNSFLFRGCDWAKQSSDVVLRFVDNAFQCVIA